MGWADRRFALASGTNSNAAFTCISVTGNAVYVAGQNAVPYQVSTSGAVAVSGVKSALFGSATCSNALRTLMTQNSTHLLENEHAKIATRSIGSEAQVSSALAGVSAFTTTYPANNSLASQLQVVAKLIAARNTLNVKRQVFMVSLGGFDLHDNLPTQHPALLTKIGQAMAAFYNTTVELGISDQVTAFTASDFGRTLASNGDGSDHGWGSHHFVMGGAVKGRQFYGNAPAVAVSGADYVGGGRLLPTSSVDQFAATLASWFGVADSELTLVVPNIRNFSTKNIGFV